MTLLLVQNFSLLTLVGVGILAFGLGFITKQSIIAKKSKRILELENEMIRNHSKILNLEKKLSEFSTEKLAETINGHKNGVHHDTKSYKTGIEIKPS